MLETLSRITPKRILKHALSDCLSWNILYSMVSIVSIEETSKFSLWRIQGQVHLFPQKSPHLTALNNLFGFLLHI